VATSPPGDAPHLLAAIRQGLRRLKGNSQTQDIPIIALSAHALAGEREKAIATGCEEFDTKPIEFDRLVATVRRVLDGRK
jgi:two-component system, cell cycle response regulator DivK